MQNDIVALNTKRIKVQLFDLLNQVRPEIKSIFPKCKILNSSGKEVQLSDIDFNKSCLFISDIDFLGIIGIYALQRINNIVYPDTTSQGTYSRIRSSYMIVESPDIRYSKMDISVVDGEKIPDMYISTNYIYKDVCLWRLLLNVGQGANERMYSLCSERLYERYLRNQIDWCFFIGNTSQFNNSYNFNFPIDTYIIKVPVDTLDKFKKEQTKIYGQRESEKGEIF